MQLNHYLFTSNQCSDKYYFCLNDRCQAVWKKKRITTALQAYKPRIWRRLRASNYCSHIILKRSANYATTCLCTCHRSVLHSVVCGRGEARLPSKLETQLMTVAFYAYLPQVKRTNAVLITSRTLCLGLGKWDCDMRGVRRVVRLSVRTMHYVQMFSTRTSSSYLCSFIHDLIIHPMSS